MGTMEVSCFGVSGRASGSLFAAAVMALSSSAVGILTEGRLVTLDIVSNLTTIGAAQADDPSHFASINKGNVVQDPGSRCERDHSRFAIFEPAIDPDQRSFPVELDCQDQRDAVLGLIRSVFGWIELETHPLL
jgi:hypothetical protein